MEDQKALEKQKREAREKELDAFWDIDSLIPARRAPIYPANTETAEVTVEPKSSVASRPISRAVPLPKREDEPERHFIPPHTAAEEKRVVVADEEYQPESALVRKVRLYRWKNEYNYYDAFARDAARLYPVVEKEVPRVSFFSYVPQYSQMTRGQLEWYLWWRENLRHGIALDTDYSYLLLYAYELINLSEKITPRVAQKALFDLWVLYREVFHQLDSYLPEWICDMGLIHRLPPPEGCVGKILAAAMSHCKLREFYVPCGGVDGYVRALLAFCSNYDYHKSKFCTEEHQKLFQKNIVGALKHVTEQMSGDGKLFSSAGMDDSKMLRDSYTGAICAYRLKRKIEVEYCSFSRSHELRFLVTDMVKYTENRIRTSLGVRSKLSIYALPTPVKELLDAYLDASLPAKTSSHRVKSEETPAYEKLYDLPSKPMSFAAAAEIEALSWNTTQRLVEAFEEEAPQPLSEPDPISAPVQAEVSDGEGDPWRDAMTPYLAFLRAALDRDVAAQRSFAQSNGKLLDLLADEINDLSAEHMGDILLEEDGGAYAVIEDYIELARDLLTDPRGKE